MRVSCWLIPRGARLFAIAIATLLACGDGEPCEAEPSGFRLDLVSSEPSVASRIASLVVFLETSDARWVRTYDVDGALADGATSLFVDLRPAATRAFDLAVAIEAHEGRNSTGKVVAEGSLRTRADANACNAFEVALEATSDKVRGELRTVEARERASWQHHRPVAMDFGLR